MIETLHSWDVALLLKLNSFHNPSWDTVMSVSTGRWIWIPIYLALFVLIILRFRKQAIPVFIAAALTIVLSDQVSRACKYGFKRERPCHNEMIASQLHVPDGCGGKYGFVSSHAANSFGLSFFIWLLWKGRKQRRWLLLLFPWAIYMTYTRIYLGVHYPLDIAGGAFVGLAVAALSVFIYRRWLVKIVPAVRNT
ncbi:MAG: membrane-associated phospholipid phosphatase [Bacteroidetes bacterium]|nr:MAG: membrane-associated phospholipid phosphatase [Bacteroidota bacterium]